MFRTLDRRPLLRDWAAGVMALLLALASAVIFCPVPPRRLFSMPALAFTILRYLPVPCLVAAAILALSGRRGHMRWALASTALWFGPIVILARSAPEWTAVPVVFWAWQIIALLVAQPPVRHRLLSVIAACSIQGVIALVALDRPLWGALGSLLPAGILAWGMRPIKIPWARLLTALAILILTLIPMSSYLEKPPASQPSAGAGADSPRPEAAHQSGDAPPTTSEVHRGVILWPPPQKHVKLVAPLPPVTRRLLRTWKSALFRIPFDGVYWFFQPPFSRPPKQSLTERGRPTEKSYRSNASLPLYMEAHQNLGTMVDLACCAQMQLEIANADPFSHAISLELILWDTSQPSKPPLSLGAMPLQSRPQFGIATTVPPVSEVLTYPVPIIRKINRFDAISIRFHRPHFRLTHSAKIAIQSFALVAHP